jgi:hypothetical protein
MIACTDQRQIIATSDDRLPHLNDCCAAGRRHRVCGVSLTQLLLGLSVSANQQQSWTKMCYISVVGRYSVNDLSVVLPVFDNQPRRSFERLLRKLLQASILEAAWVEPSVSCPAPQPAQHIMLSYWRLLTDACVLLACGPHSTPTDLLLS